jgi:restriction system protein
MARRNERSVLDDLFEVLIEVPSWIGPVLAGIAYIVMAWFVPWLLRPKSPTDIAQTVFSQLSPQFAPWIAVVILFMWIGAELRKFLNRRRFDRQSGIQSIRDLSWDEFEDLISEVYRRQGYAVEHTGKPGPDGGVDHRLSKDGSKSLVQCKHWRRQQVGVTVIRELLGVMTSERATTGIVVTSGTFTEDAIDFAARNRITLIDGHRLELMIQDLRMKPSVDPPKPATPISKSSPGCPRCGATMAHRTARRGAIAGESFWGCPNFPSCKGTRPID